MVLGHSGPVPTPLATGILFWNQGFRIQTRVNPNPHGTPHCQIRPGVPAPLTWPGDPIAHRPQALAPGALLVP